MRQLHVGVIIAAMTLIAAGCGGKKTCTVGQSGDCGSGQVCETVEGGKPACFDPVVLEGKVFDTSDNSGVSGATVVALDVNRSPVTSVATTGTDGTYTLTLPSARSDTKGTPVSQTLTLRADAAGYQTFPSGLRQALPIDTTGPDHTGSQWVVQTVQTDVGLIPDANAGAGMIHGTADAPDAATGVLVVAETAGGKGRSAIADTDGAYRIFNVPDGSYTVKAYAKGTNYTPGTATVSGGNDAKVDLNKSGDPTATVSGSVSIVDPGSGTGTSVILVVASTFDGTLGRGEAVPGLRAPSPGTAPNITGAFSIDGVPEGDYVVLAGLENDNLVRDPDTCIAGTGVVTQSITGGGDVSISQTFKITGALDVIGPGVDGPEAVTGTPSFTWQDDSSEDAYDVEVFDSFGNVVWQTTIPGSSGTNPVVPYGGPALQSGMYYQFRATSTKSNPGQGTCEISRTEDLKGVFYVK